MTAAPTPSVSDRELWRRLPQADEEAFGMIFDRHAGAVYNHAFRRVSDWDLAQDVTQKVFTQLWQRCLSGRVDRLRAESSRGILLVMTRNVCNNEIRGRTRGLRLIEKAGPQTQHVVHDTDEWVEAQSTMATIRQSLAGLPEGQRDVIELVCWSDLSVTEAAAALRISEGTVRSRLSRARRTLADSPAAELLQEK